MLSVAFHLSRVYLFFETKFVYCCNNRINHQTILLMSSQFDVGMSTRTKLYKQQHEKDREVKKNNNRNNKFRCRALDQTNFNAESSVLLNTITMLMSHVCFWIYLYISFSRRTKYKLKREINNSNNKIYLSKIYN